jgi:hypothetical protein
VTPAPPPPVSALIPVGDSAQGPFETVFFVLLGLVCGAAVLSAAAWGIALLRAQRRQHARLEASAKEPLSPGARRVVRGTVDLDGPSDVAIEIEIDQVVTNHKSKNRTWYTWDEFSRDVERSPFYLDPGDGEPIYVEPDEQALVVDEIATTYPQDAPGHRMRCADVRRGEVFFAYGDLVRATHPRASGAYRDGVGWVLRPPARGRMLLATRAIRDRYTARARFLLVWGLLFGALFAAFHGWLTCPFVAVSFAGESGRAEIVDTWAYDTTYKGKTTTHYAMRLRLDDGRTIEDEFSGPTWAWATESRVRGEAVSVPIVRAPGWTSRVYVGTEPYLPVGGAIVGFVVAAVSFTLFFARYPRTYAWYDRTRLDESGGEGAWKEPRPARPVDPSK